MKTQLKDAPSLSSVLAMCQLPLLSILIPSSGSQLSDSRPQGGVTATLNHLQRKPCCDLRSGLQPEPPEGNGSGSEEEHLGALTPAHHNPHHHGNCQSWWLRKTGTWRQKKCVWQVPGPRCQCGCTYNDEPCSRHDWEGGFPTLGILLHKRSRRYHRELLFTTDTSG